VITTERDPPRLTWSVTTLPEWLARDWEYVTERKVPEARGSYEVAVEKYEQAAFNWEWTCADPEATLDDLFRAQNLLRTADERYDAAHAAWAEARQQRFEMMVGPLIDVVRGVAVHPPVHTLARKASD
jgi:hypothetical protein